MSGQTVIGENGFRVKREELFLDDTPPEPIICSHFGCNKQLSHTESLYSNKCFLHQNLKRIDINKIISK